jgi:hypothetical protein
MKRVGGVLSAEKKILAEDGGEEFYRRIRSVLAAGEKRV